MTPFVLMILLLQTPDSIVSKIGISQKLGTQIDPGIVLRDEHNADIRLGDLFGKRPILLTPVYYECPMLCSQQLNALGRALKVMSLDVGNQFEIVTFSIDPSETPELARDKKDHYVRDYGRAGADQGWHFLTGSSVSVARLTDDIGFRYAYDPSTGQYAHATTLLVLTPAGKISKYFLGIEYDPGDLKRALMDAERGKTGSFLEAALLFCYQYDPLSGKYSLAILRLIRLGGVLTVVGLGIVMALSSRKRRLSKLAATGQIRHV